MTVADMNAGTEVGAMNTDAPVAAADFEQDDGLSQRVLFVIAEFVDDAQAVLAILLRPVTRFAGLARRTKVGHRRWNGCVISVKGNREYLADSRQLTAH